MPLCRYFNIFIFSKKKGWFIILKKLLNEKQYHLYIQSCIKQKDWSNKSVLISWIIVEFVYRASMRLVIIWLHSLLYDESIFWSDDDGDCVKILSHEADVLHFWNDKHRSHVAPADGLYKAQEIEGATFLSMIYLNCRVLLSD